MKKYNLVYTISYDDYGSDIIWRQENNFTIGHAEFSGNDVHVLILGMTLEEYSFIRIKHPNARIHRG